MYDYGDYLNWSKEERWEIINGIAYNLAPSPSRKHQKISGELFVRLHSYLKGSRCEVYHAPFDVRLPKDSEDDKDIKTVVRPDLSIICDPAKLDGKGCKGSPDLIIEIVSSSSLRIDIKEKFYLYESVGVREYWIVYPNDKTIVVYKLNSEGKYGRPEVFSEEEKINVGIFNDLSIDLREIFES